MVTSAKLASGLAFAFLLALGCGDDGGNGTDAADADVDDQVEGDTQLDGADDGTPCDGCLIGSECLAASARNTDNPCEICDPARAADAWSPDDGAPCDDGVVCNGEDSCGGGSCSVHAGDPCGDDGFFCNGTESCDESSGECVRSGNPCDGIDETCYESEGACCAPAAGRACNADGDVVSTDSCGHPEGVLETCPDVAHAVCVEGYCGCEPGFAGADCTGCVVFVSGDDGDDAADGRSWAAAKATVQAGLDLAAVDGCEVWVAAAASPYLPTLGTGTRFRSIQLRSGVAIYGGFAGDEAVREQRDPAANETVLSGDLGAAGTASDNACHVVTALATGAGTRIDGFTIREGQADCLDDGAGGALDWRAQQGGAMWVEGGTLAVAGCRLTANATAGNGTAYLLDTVVTFDETTFDGNTVVGGGGGVFVNGTAATVTCSNCTFRGNTAQAGGGLYAFGGAHATLTGCTLADNEVTGDGGGFYVAPSSRVTLTDCTVSGNSAGGSGGGGASANESGSFAVRVAALRTVLADNTAAVDGGGFAEPGFWAEGDYLFERCVFRGNAAGERGGGIAVGDCSSGSLVRNCDFVGNSAGIEAGGVYAPRGECRGLPGVNSIVWGNTAPENPECISACGGWPNSIWLEDPRLVNIDPARGPLDLHLLPTSPAIDAGRDPEATPADFEGRPWTDDPATPNCDGSDPTAPECGWYSDIGALEYVP